MVKGNVRWRLSTKKGIPHFFLRKSAIKCQCDNRAPSVRNPELWMARCLGSSTSNDFFALFGVFPESSLTLIDLKNRNDEFFLSRFIGWFMSDCQNQEICLSLMNIHRYLVWLVRRE
jgi:hypothetical protein